MPGNAHAKMQIVVEVEISVKDKLSEAQTNVAFDIVEESITKILDYNNFEIKEEDCRSLSSVHNNYILKTQYSVTLLIECDLRIIPGTYQEPSEVDWSDTIFYENVDDFNSMKLGMENYIKERFTKDESLKNLGFVESLVNFRVVGAPHFEWKRV